MTHHTLISSAPAFSSAPHASPSSSSSPTRSFSSAPAAVLVMSSSSSFAHHHGSLVEREGNMYALRSSLRPCEAAEEAAAAVVAGPAAWGDGFLVEDLLDLEELCEVEKEGGLLCEAPAPAAEEDEEQKCSDSHGSSVVSYELMPLLPPEMDLPAHDAEELEWVSRIMDDSLAELPPPPRLPAAPWRQREATVSTAAYPMRTPTICALSTEALVPVRSKKRSKRSRATTVWSLSGAQSISDSASSSTTSSSSSSASFFLMDSPAFYGSNLLDEPARSKKSKHGKPKKRGRKPKHHFPPQLLAASAPAQGDRRCSHCGVQKTPQWRAGPEGAKTLCNACGVRYKSGRLLPEYRPACSPTFVGDLHSNSHRKVLEMRRKKDPVAVAALTVASF
ncbi:GATA transcription factor 5 [Lolium perenne]|uniref:GATA transcription factor 5 n=1 Tax=Lolium perenne TaxID=4522 RepID=UPI0021EA1815|nr:GATA transcription factor 5-like [Lolium perenne]